jgi:hypothetical protein
VANSMSCPSCGRIVTNPDAGFCGRCGAKLRRSQWWRILTAAAGVLASVLIAVGLYNVFRTAPSVVGSSAPPSGGADPATEPPSILEPRMSFDLNTDEDLRTGKVTALKIIYLTGPQSVGIQRVVVNGRAGEEGCDFARGNLIKACMDTAEKDYAASDAPNEFFEGEYQGHKGQAEEGLVKRSEEVCRHLNDRAATDDEFKTCWDRWLEDRGFAPGTPLIPEDVKRLTEESKREAAIKFEQDKADCVKSGSSDQPWPQTLKLGDALTISVSCGDRTVSAKIFTDDGREATYQVH